MEKCLGVVVRQPHPGRPVAIHSIEFRSQCDQIRCQEKATLVGMWRIDWNG